MILGLPVALTFDEIASDLDQFMCLFGSIGFEILRATGKAFNSNSYL